MKRGGPEVAQGGLPWSAQPQSLLVTAAIGRDEEVEPAFRAWRALVDIEGPLDGGTYRLLPLVYERMRSLSIADPLLGRLKGVYRRAWVETHTLFHATAPAVARLELAGVHTLLLKGAPLAITYYRSHGARPMHDLDVVVPTSSARSGPSGAEGRRLAARHHRQAARAGRSARARSPRRCRARDRPPLALPARNSLGCGQCVVLELGKAVRIVRGCNASAEPDSNAA